MTAAGWPCLRRRCGGRYELLAEHGRERMYVCRSCGDGVVWHPLPGDAPMPSERGVPAAELLDPSELPARTLGQIIRGARDQDQGDDL